MNTYISQCNNFATTHTKCDTKDILRDESGDTCATVLETLKMSEKHVYMIGTTHYHIDYPLKQNKTLLYAISDNSHAKR